MKQASTLHPGSENSWTSLSVQDFFGKINWENIVIQMPLPTVTAKERTVTPNMTVSTFFSVIPWEGEMVIAPPVSLESPSDGNDESDALTLDDFSGLF